MKETVFLVLFLLFYSFTFSQQLAQSEPVNSKTQEFQSVSEFETTNGLKVIVKPRPTTATVAVGLFVRGGVRNLTPETTGIENFALSVAIEGSKNFPRDVLKRELSRIGSSINVEASEDFSVISLVSTKTSFSKSWQIFSDLIINPAFEDKDLSIVRERILTILRSRSISPDNFLDVLQRRFIYEGHPYANEPLGTIENINRFTLKDVQDYYRRILQTSQLLLVFVGDVDVEDVKKRVAETFGKLPKGDYRQKPLPALKFDKPTLEVVERNVQTNYVRGVFAAPSPSDPDYYPMKVAISLLQSRLNQEIRLERQLSYAPDASMNDNEANTASIYVTAVDANQAVELMLKEILKLRRETLDENSFVGFPGFFSTMYYLRLETNASQVGELGRYELIGGGWRNSLMFLERINQVKPADVRRVAQKYMRNIRFIVVGNSKSIDEKVFLNQ
ncbi:MAG: insulinase family protein [Pyrinomonadaceae bacterium]|nr:insulinase family protein [Pyrinomonadaceae bacterium]MCX7639261.1 insulinase family protein [Pyrinomonadaceae bacterium]MDW8303517.1 pitrilysin family protein [Acidobacteriota bacterium]